jgi:hypothetical protein
MENVEVSGTLTLETGSGLIGSVFYRHPLSEARVGKSWLSRMWRSETIGGVGMCLRLIRQ